MSANRPQHDTFWSKWVIIVLRQLSNFSTILWRDQITVQWDDDDDDVPFVLDQCYLTETTVYGYICRSTLAQYPDSELTRH